MYRQMHRQKWIHTTFKKKKKKSNYDTDIIEHHFVICTVKYTHLCIMHGAQTRKLTKTFENVHLKKKRKKLEWGLTSS